VSENKRVRTAYETRIRNEKNMAETLYKTGDAVPAAGRYQCVVCGFIVEYTRHHVDLGVAFGECSVCHAGTEDGPKKADEDVWKAI